MESTVEDEEAGKVVKDLLEANPLAKEFFDMGGVDFRTFWRRDPLISAFG
jgi:hypothetical protein